ncbi:tetratricopeptide repeat protein [Acaryochloris marina NIES-2412]|uniref:tetratricopeptide repeat protein n=1 Tax=Acaryochloris marina TaxID=155978 RepID=UPI004059D88C
MNKLFYRSNLRVAIAIATALSAVSLTDFAIAKPIKDCPPVVRSLKTKKLYCAHELKILREQRAEDRDASFLCLVIRAIVQSNDYIKANQCFPKINFSNETGQKILPKPKGANTVLKLIKPIGTAQLTPQPVIAWQPIPNANYRITIEQGGQWLWSHETTSTEIKLPASQSLKHGTMYKVSVVAVTGDESTEDVAYLRLVEPKQLRELDDAILQAQNVAPDPLDRGLDKAMMLYHLGLFDAAVTQLLSLTPFQEPVVYSQLGLIYKEAGHKRIAQKYFDKASELVKRKPKPVSKFP